MIKTLQNLTAALVCCCLMFMSSAVMAQCPCPIDGAALWQGADASIYANDTIVGTTCAYAGEYTNFTVAAGSTYEVFVSVNSNSTSLYNAPAVTVFDSNDSTAVACGLDMTTFTATYDGIYHALATEVDSTGNLCVAESVCHVLSIVCTSCTEIAPTCDDGIMNGEETDIDCGGSSCLPCPMLVETCDTTSVDSGGTAADYSNNESTITTYCPDASSMGNIQATFSTFATETCCDFLSVYDGMDTNAPLLGTFSGTAIPSAMIASTDGCLTFQFSSDGSVTAAGWEADITCVNCSVPMLDAMAYCNAGDGSGYYVDITFTPGSGSSYTLTDGTTPISLTAASTFTVGPYANASTTTFTVTDDNDDCSATATASFNCGPGQTCDDPIMIASLPYMEMGATTEGFGNDYGSADVCGSNYATGDDIVYNFVATDTCVNITLTNTGTWVGVFLLDGCPEDPATTCVATANSGSGTDPSIEGASVMMGSDYFVIVSTWPSPQFTAFDMTIEACPIPCDTIMVMASATDVTCAGNDGMAMVTGATGGSGNYVSVQWSNGAVGNSTSGLVMGNYMVTVTDDMGCTGEAMVTVGDGCVSTCGETSNLMHNFDTVDPLVLTVSWDAVAGAEAYQLAGRKSGGPVKVFPEFANTVTSRTFTGGILYNQAYDWSVRVKCNGTWTAYAPIASFTTPPPPATAAKNVGNNTYDIFAEGNNLSVSVYPNPANAQVVLNLMENANFENVATQKIVHITDMLGRVINTYNTTDTQMTLNVNQFANGSYFVAVSNGNETVVEKLLIVR